MLRRWIVDIFDKGYWRWSFQSGGKEDHREDLWRMIWPLTPREKLNSSGSSWIQQQVALLNKKWLEFQTFSSSCAQEQLLNAKQHMRPSVEVIRRSLCINNFTQDHMLVDFFLLWNLINGWKRSKISDKGQLDQLNIHWKEVSKWSKRSRVQWNSRSKEVFQDEAH